MTTISSRHPIRKNQSGQTSVFMALFITTMMLLFAFTTNVGMLVHAKINLQNAADAAAYAGAAVQARQLTTVSYLNYEMRRALKEFLFYFTVRSQYAALPCYPSDVSGRPQYGFCPGVSGDSQFNFAFFDPRENNNETGGPYLPTVCIIFHVDNNYCQKASVPGIPEFQSGGGWGVADPIVNAVINATNQIIQKKTDDCLGRTEINQNFVIAWLFNVYPLNDNWYRTQFTIGNDSDDPFDANGIDRLGILPRMAMLRARVDNIEEALNLNLQTEGVGGATISESTMGTLKGATNANKTLDYFERPIQAFLSAHNNLPKTDRDNGVFSDVQLTELVPNRAGNVTRNPDLRNPPILAYFKDMSQTNSFANSKFFDPHNGLRGACKQIREIRTVNAFPYGITKDPSILTYYAVRLEAKVRLLFSPFGSDGTVTISAYSAAKPFGSRIGKDLSANPDKYMVMRASDGVSALVTGLSPEYPNPLVSDTDQSAKTDGFTRNSNLGYLRNAMIYNNTRENGVKLAGAYSPWEVGFYNPPANFQRPENIGLFADNPDYTSSKRFRLIAPILPVNKPGETGLSFLREKVLRMLDGNLLASGTLNDDPRFRAFKDGMLSDAMFNILHGYMKQEKLMDAHLVPDPLLNDEPQVLNYARSFGSRFTVAGMNAAQRRQLTSWNNQKTASDGDAAGIPAHSELGLDFGRSGYSVKFVSFATLGKGGRSSNDPDVGGSWRNPFDRFDAGGAGGRIADDLKKIKH